MIGNFDLSFLSFIEHGQRHHIIYECVYVKSIEKFCLQMYDYSCLVCAILELIILNSKSCVFGIGRQLLYEQAISLENQHF